MANMDQTNTQNAAAPQLRLGQLGGPLASGDIVNLFRGNLSFPLEVISLPGRNGLDCKVNLLYQSNVQYTVDKWNLDHSTDIAGMGWSLPYEQIVASAKNNGSRLDNDYYLITQGQTQKLIPIPVNWELGRISGATVQKLAHNRVDSTVQQEWKQLRRQLSGQFRLKKQSDNSYLIYDDGMERVYKLRPVDNDTYQVITAGQSFELGSFQYWQINYYQEYEKWEIIKDDGSIYTYGSNDLAAESNTLQYGIKWNNWVGTTTQGNGTQYISAWNLAQVTNIYGNYYKFIYTVTNQNVGQGTDIFYTKECHVSQIINDFGWSLQYTYLPKTYDTASLDAPKEYLDPHQDPAKMPMADAFQSQYSTVYLDKISLLNAANNTLIYVQFDYYDLQNLSPKNGNDPIPLVELAYGAMYKRYLKGITHYYQDCETRPGIQFTYNFTTDAAQNRGALTAILSPTGAIGTINYKEIQVGADDKDAPGARNKSIDNPFGASKKDQARIWYGDDYVVNTWYSDDESALKLNVFTWMGTWYQCADEWFVFDKHSIDIDNLQIATSDNTFLLAIRYQSSRESEVYLFNRRPLCQGHWDIQQENGEYKSYSYGTEVLNISNGENFFIVNGIDTDNNKVVDRYAWNWSAQAWEVDHLADHCLLCQASSSSYDSKYYSTAHNNYYIILCHDQTQDPVLNKFSIYYLEPAMNEDGTLNWQLGSTFETDQVSIPSIGSFSYFNFAPSDSFAAAAYITEYIGGSDFTRFNYELQILTWDENFANLTFAKIENVEADNFKNIPSPIVRALGPQAVDNTLAGAGPNIYYYDGAKWQYQGASIHYPSTFRDPSIQYYWYAYTADTILKTENTDSGIYTELTYRDINNPDAGWKSIVLQDSDPVQDKQLRQNQGYPSLTSTYLTHGAKVYNRGVYNTWATGTDLDNINEDYLLVDFSELEELKDLTINTSTIINQAPYFIAFMTVDIDGDPTATYIAFLRNGDFIRNEDGDPILEEFDGQQVTTLLDKQYHYQRSLNGKLPSIPLGFVTYSIEQELGKSKSIVLHRYANESVQAPINAFVVDSVQVNTGYDTRSKCYEYADVTAAQDATGTIVRFQTVTEYHGCRSPGDQKNGYTISHFYNGLPPTASPRLSTLGSKESHTCYSMLDGMLLAKEQYDVTGKLLISSTTYRWTVATQIATDAQGGSLRSLYGGIARVYATSNMLDGVKSITKIVYSKTSGNPDKTTSRYYGSTGKLITNQTLTTYAYEKYEMMWRQNLLKPVAQTLTQAKTGEAAYEIQAIDVQTYQQWDGAETPYWAPNAQYTATKADAPTFIWWNGDTPGEGWLKTGTILNRNTQGAVIESEDVDRVKSTTIYDDQELFSLASFVNAGANENGISYDSFETCQTTKWTFSQASGAATISTDSFTGTNCYNITSSGSLSKTITLTQREQAYVFAGWFKTTPGVDDTTVTMSLTDTSTKATKVLSLTDGQWQYRQWVVNPGAHGMTASDLQLAIEIGINTANAYVRLDNLFWIPLNSTFTADTYDEDLLLHTASIAPNGVCKKTCYNLFYKPIGQTSVYDNIRGFKTAFMIRQTTDMTDGAAFPTGNPNFGLTIGGQDQGFYDQFKADALDQYTFINSTAEDWQVSGQQLHLNNTNTAPLGAQAQRKNFQADSLAVYITLDTDSSNTVSLGTGKVYVLWNGTKWQLVQDNGSTLTTLQEATTTGFQKEWLMAVFDGRIMFFANGICLFNYQLTDLAPNNVVLGMQQSGSFNPIMVAENISLSLSYQDGTGKELQTIDMESGSSVILKATLYDNLGRDAISVKPSRITTDEVDNPFAYYEDYITNGSVSGEIWDGKPMTGPAADTYHPDDGGYPFSRQVYESAPTQRPVKIGQAGKDFAITDQGNPHITTIKYGANEGDPGFLYPLPARHYFETTITDPDGNITIQYMDVFQKVQQEKAKQNGEDAPDDYIGVVQKDPSSEAYIKYSWVYDIKGQLIAVLPPSYYEILATPTDTGALPAQASVYSYDFLGRQITSSTPDTGASKYIYDNLDQVRFYQDATGAAQGYLNYVKYDNLGRILEKGYYDFDWNEQTQAELQNYADNDPTWPDAATTWYTRYTYDGDDATPNMIGNIWKSFANNQDSQDADVTETFAYDRLGNTTCCQLVVNSYSAAIYTIDYEYNPAGMPLAATDSVTGLKVTKSYNPLRQITDVSATTRDHTTTKLASYTYTQEGDLEQAVLLPSGASALTTRAYTYMPTGWPKTIADDSIAETLQYTEGSCDDSGYYTGAIANQSVQYKKGQALTDDYCFKVDYLNRVATARNSDTSNTWIMDANSNFISHLINDVTRTYTTTPNTNQLVSVSASDRSFTKTYNYTEAGETDSIMDGNNTLMQFVYAKGNGLPQTIMLPDNTGNDTVVFTYNSDNTRVLKTALLTDKTVFQRLYIHGLASKPTLEIDNSDNAEQVKRYIYIPGATVIFFDDNYYMALKDHLDSTRTIMDQSANITGQYNYDVYGNPTIIKTPDFAYDYLYSDQEYDTQTGLYNYKARLYAPDIGRFIMTDPEMQYFSPYVYAGNNPVILVDPSGESAWSILAGIFAGLEIVAGFAIDMCTCCAAEPIGGLLVGAGINGLATSVEGKGFGEYLKSEGIGAISGVITGGISAMGEKKIESKVASTCGKRFVRKGCDVLARVGVQVTANTFGNLAGQIAGNLIMPEDYSWRNVLPSIGFGALCGFVSGGAVGIAGRKICQPTKILGKSVKYLAFSASFGAIDALPDMIKGDWNSAWVNFAVGAVSGIGAAKSESFTRDRRNATANDRPLGIQVFSRVFNNDRSQTPTRRRARRPRRYTYP